MFDESKYLGFGCFESDLMASIQSGTVILHIVWWSNATDAYILSASPLHHFVIVINGWNDKYDDIWMTINNGQAGHKMNDSNLLQYWFIIFFQVVNDAATW